MLVPHEIVQALLKNSLFFCTLLFTHPKIRIIDERDVQYVISEIVDATYNNVWQTRSSNQEIDAMINQIKAIFKEKNLPLTWWVDPSDTPCDLSERLLDHGFLFSEQTSIMSREKGVPLLPGEENLLTLKKVTTENQLLDFCTVKGGTEEETNMHYELFHKFIEAQAYPIELLVGYYHQEPVCVAVTVSIDGIGSIHSFATHEAYQGKGYGSQMLALVLTRLYNAECDLVLLDSSENAVKL